MAIELPNRKYRLFSLDPDEDLGSCDAELFAELVPVMGVFTACDNDVAVEVHEGRAFAGAICREHADKLKELKLA